MTTQLVLFPTISSRPSDASPSGDVPSAPLDEHGAPVVDLTEWDWIVVNHSAGKDGQCALRRVARQAAEQGVLHRVIVQYNDLGARVSWPSTAEMGPNAERLVELLGDRPGTRRLAELHARHYGVRFEVTRRDGGDLLDEIKRRGKFPDAGRRWCTSDFKRGPGFKLLTRITRELELDRPARILYVFGFRAAESSARAKKVPFSYNAAASGSGNVRRVYDWYPVHHWSDEQVWADIHASGLPYAWPYDAGMSRLSCSFCVLAGAADLTLAAALRPDVAAQYAAVEAGLMAQGSGTGRTFQAGRTMQSIVGAATTARDRLWTSISGRLRRVFSRR